MCMSIRRPWISVKYKDIECEIEMSYASLVEVTISEWTCVSGRCRCGVTSVKDLSSFTTASFAMDFQMVAWKTPSFSTEDLTYICGYVGCISLISTSLPSSLVSYILVGYMTRLRRYHLTKDALFMAIPPT